MRKTILAAGVYVGLCATSACDRIKRETVDRIDDHEASVWTSREDCEALLAEHRSPTRGPRIGTWNVRYFPDGVPGTEASETQETDVGWLACAMASLDVDILVVQEFKTHDRALAKQGELVTRLNELTGGDWQIELSPCDPPEVQHPGFVYDASRVQGSNFHEFMEMNPDPVCSNEVSPGFGGYFEIDGGPDFHLIAVHLQVGCHPDLMDRRIQSLQSMQQVIDQAYAAVPDTDIFFAGDFNTAGCDEDDCNPMITSDEEVAAMAAMMAEFETPLALIPEDQTCTYAQDDKQNFRIDHIVVDQAAQEVPAGSVAVVSGICAETGCDRLRNWLEDAEAHLSDHCPVTLELAAMDAD